jgi:hypothetical protein
MIQTLLARVSVIEGKADFNRLGEPADVATQLAAEIKPARKNSSPDPQVLRNLRGRNQQLRS